MSALQTCYSHLYLFPPAAERPSVLWTTAFQHHQSQPGYTCNEMWRNHYIKKKHKNKLKKTWKNDRRKENQAKKNMKNHMVPLGNHLEMGWNHIYGKRLQDGILFVYLQGENQLINYLYTSWWLSHPTKKRSQYHQIWKSNKWPPNDCRLTSAALLKNVVASYDSSVGLVMSTDGIRIPYW